MLAAVGMLGLVMLLLRRGVRRNIERADQAFAAESEIPADAAAEAHRDAVRARHRGAALDSALAMLSRVADGRADPADDEVRRECAREESYLRELTTLPVGLERLGSGLAELLVEAHRGGVELSVRASDATDAPDDVTAARVLAVVSSAVRCSDPGHSVVLGLSSTGEKYCATLVASASCAAGLEAALADTATSGYRLRDAELEVAGDQAILEMWWPAT